MHNWLVICFTILIAFILSFTPMPEWAVWLRPAWVVMVLIYWVIANPYVVNIGFAWMVGLLFDLLSGTMVGEHALAFVIVIYFVSGSHIRLRMCPLLQQSLTIFLFILLYQFIVFCLQGFIGELPGSNWYWASSLTSMLLWPWLFILMRDSMRRLGARV